jgi:hypothetical protein
LRFSSLSDAVLGPARSFHIEGSLMRQHPHDEVVSRYVDGMWHLIDEFGAKIIAAGFECLDRLQLQFEDRQGRTSPRYGNFGQVECRDDRIFADGALFAVRARATQFWQHVGSGVRWPILNLLPPRHDGDFAAVMQP